MGTFSLVSHSVWPYTGSDVIRIPTMTSRDVIRTSTMTSIVWVWVCDTSLLERLYTATFSAYVTANKIACILRTLRGGAPG